MNGDVFGQAGGQNQAMGSKVLAFETNHEFTYVVGDATATCNPDKCRKMIRHFLFLPPAHFVVFDRVETTDETFRKTWLLHHANEPKVSGQSWTSIQNGGRVLVQTLLPADAVLEKVGGPGKEFLADGVNYAIDAGPSQYIRDKQYPIGKIEYDETPELMGRWRMEVSPGEPRKIDLFLHLIHVGDLDMEPDEENVNTVAEDDHVRMKISSGNRKVELELPISDEFTGNIRIQEGDRVIVEKELARDVLPQEGLASLVP
jgi:heparin/heparan-sulfate lyase